MRALTTALLGSLFAVALTARAAVPPWVTEAAKSSLPAALVKDAKAAVLLDDVEVTVTSADVVTTRHRRVLKILTAAGAALGYASVPFDGDTDIRVLHGWAIDEAGREYEVRERDAVQLTPYAGELYSDARVKVLRLPAATPGSVIAYEYEQRDRPYLLQTVWRFQSDLPVARARFHLVLPVAWTYDARWSKYDPVEPEGSDATSATWELRDVPAIGDEPRMPDPDSLAGSLGLSFVSSSAYSPKAHQSWDDIGRWFYGLASPRAVRTPEVEAKVRALAHANAAESVHAMARFAQKDVRYVAVEIGIGGYQPHAAADVFANRYGDCKDKATLLRTMLAAIGVASDYVLVHTTRGMVDPRLPTIEAFNHVILAIHVPRGSLIPAHATIDHPRLGKLLIFDPTSTLTPFGDLPPYLQAGQGLLVTSDGGEIIELPMPAPEVNQLRRVARLKLGADGTLTGEVEEVRTGTVASEIRGALQPLTTAERARYFDSVLASHLASSTSAGLSITGVDDAEAELVVKYTFRAPDYGKRVAGMMLVRPRVIGEKAEAIADASTRRYGYVMDGPSVQIDDVSIAIDPSLTLDELPAATEVSTPLFGYSSHTELANGTLHYTRRYVTRSFVVDRASLPELNRAFSQIAADERASAVFK
jgi:transglutaminase-like putative cysteine protease